MILYVFYIIGGRFLYFLRILSVLYYFRDEEIEILRKDYL